MANKITDMSKIRKQLNSIVTEKLSCLQKNLSFSRNTVKKYISLFETLVISFEAINEKTDAELELLFSHTTVESVIPKLQILYDFFPKMERELKKIGFTVQYLWKQYVSLNRDDYRSSQFCFHCKILGNESIQ